MIDLIKKILGNGEKTEQLKSSGKKDINLATCALLVEMANADGEFSEQERKNIINIFTTKYNLNQADIEELIHTSGEELENSIDLWQFTNLINKNYSLEEKLQVIEIIWQVAYSDGKLDKHEDYLVHKLASLLRLNHKQLIDAKLKVIHN